MISSGLVFCLLNTNAHKTTGQYGKVLTLAARASPPSGAKRPIERNRRGIAVFVRVEACSFWSLSSHVGTRDPTGERCSSFELTPGSFALRRIEIIPQRNRRTLDFWTPSSDMRPALGMNLLAVGCSPAPYSRPTAVDACSRRCN
jgi:hypothetical protein